MMKFEHKNNNKILAVMVLAVMVCAGLFVFTDDSSAAVTTGSCGENLTWSYDSETTALTISGEGTTIQDYTSAGAPWHDLNVTNVVFDCPNLTTVGAYAFKDCNMSNTKLPYKITTIKEGAFANCLMLSLTKLPDKLTTIGNGAFEHCIRLNIQTIPYGVTSIGANVFKDCMGIHVMIIPSTITAIDDTAFDGTTGLTSVANLSSVNITGKFPYKTTDVTTTASGSAGTDLYWYWFDATKILYIDGVGNATPDLNYDTNQPWNQYKTNITSVCMECPNLQTLGNNSFAGGLFYNFDLPGGLISIGEYCFSTCSNWTLSELPSELENIGRQAFGSCNGITISEIPVNVTTIPRDAFRLCVNISSMHLHKNVTTIGTSAFPSTIKVVFNESSLDIQVGATTFGGIAQFADYVFKGKFVGDMMYRTKTGNIAELVVVTGYSATKSQFVVPNSVNINGVDYTVTSIGASAFSYAMKDVLTDISIPESITTIGTRAFEGCSLINKIIIPPSITLINTDAFKGCTNLKTVYNESELEIIKGSDSNGYVGYYADNIYNGLPYGDFIFTIIDENYVKVVGYIGDISTATSITIPGNIELEDQPYTVSAIGEGVFKDNTTVTNVVLPGTILTIGNEAFMGATALTTINGLSSVEYVGVSAFEGTTIVIPVTAFSSLTAVGNYAFEDSMIDWTVLPATLTDIGNNAFDGSQLNITTIPETVETVGMYAFANCPNIDSYIIVRGNVQLGDHLFDGNTNLYGVVLYDNPQISTDTFSGAGISEVLNLSEIEDLSAYNGLNTSVIANSMDALAMIQQKDNVVHDFVPSQDTASKILRMLPIFIILSILGAVAYGIYRKDDRLFD